MLQNGFIIDKSVIALSIKPSATALKKQFVLSLILLNLDIYKVLNF